MSGAMSAIGTKQTSPSALHMSAFDPKRTWTHAPQQTVVLPRHGEVEDLLRLSAAHVRHRSWRMSSTRCLVTCVKSTSARLARAMIVSSSSMYRVRIASKP